MPKPKTIVIAILAGFVLMLAALVVTTEPAQAHKITNRMCAQQALRKAREVMPATRAEYRKLAAQCRKQGARHNRAHAAAAKKARVREKGSASASAYGPGLYGNTTACGQTLRAGTVGVAHKTLPCGTKILFENNGRPLHTTVIDRGPYVGERVFDLTEAAVRSLGYADAYAWGHRAVKYTVYR